MLQGLAAVAALAADFNVVEGPEANLEPAPREFFVVDDQYTPIHYLLLYPLITASGSRRATFVAIPSPSTTSTTRLTSL